MADAKSNTTGDNTDAGNASAGSPGSATAPGSAADQANISPVDALFPGVTPASAGMTDFLEFMATGAPSRSDLLAAVDFVRQMPPVADILKGVADDKNAATTANPDVAFVAYAFRRYLQIVDGRFYAQMIADFENGDR